MLMIQGDNDRDRINIVLNTIADVSPSQYSAISFIYELWLGIS